MDNLDKFDLKAFQEARSIFRDRFAKALKDFYADCEDLIERIVEGERNNDTQIVMENAHSLKSSSMAFGLAALGELAKSIEHGASRALENGEELGDDVRRQVSNLQEALSRGKATAGEYI